jgi:hypothetical protein
LRKVWPWKLIENLGEDFVRETNILPSAFTGDVALAMLLMLVGIALVLAMEYFAGKTKPDTA